MSAQVSCFWHYVKFLISRYRSGYNSSDMRHLRCITFCVLIRSVILFVFSNRHIRMWTRSCSSPSHKLGWRILQNHFPCTLMLVS